MEKWSRFNIASVVLGFGFLYLPIVLLVIFSFNESKLSPSGPGSRPNGTPSSGITRDFWTRPG